MLAPEADVHLLCIFVAVKTIPAEVHGYNPRTGVDTFCRTGSLDSHLSRAAELIREVAARIVEHQVVCATFLVAEQPLCLQWACDRALACVDTAAVVVEAVLLCLCPKSAVEVNDIRPVVASILPVVVDTVETEVHQAVDDSVYILEVTFLVLCCTILNPAASAVRTAASCVEELDTREHVGTVLVSSVGP